MPVKINHYNSLILNNYNINTKLTTVKLVSVGNYKKREFCIQTIQRLHKNNSAGYICTDLMMGSHPVNMHTSILHSKAVVGPAFTRGEDQMCN